MNRKKTRRMLAMISAIALVMSGFGAMGLTVFATQTEEDLIPEMPE